LKLEGVSQAVSDFCSESPLNTLVELNSLRIFEQPLLGIAEACDPLFDELKKESVIGPDHISPKDWMAGAKSVITYFLPFTERVRKANRVLGLPATEWLYGRIEGERFNVELRQFLVHQFSDAGFDSIAPALDARYEVRNRKSNWSERHVAYIGGLGTFSLSCSLITRLGSAGRIGSVVTSADLTPTARTYRSKDEYCSKCGSCISRCPRLAISVFGKDHLVCSDFLDRVKLRYSPRYGCGKCQTGVPCESRIPANGSV
jgi:epoxyqueuosine reductase QueG